MDREGLDLGTITPACIVEQQGPESLPTEAVGEPHEAGGYPHVARVLPEYHDAFCPEDERDETDLLQFVIDTADCRPLR